MKATPLAIPEVILFEPTVYSDERGFFFESFNHKKFEEIVGYSVNFVQDNHSKSIKGVVRGLHYQSPPKTQGKLIHIIQGEVFDVAVDIRKNSPTFGKWVGERLSGENKKQLWIPEGFAHGFLTLSTTAECVYKVTKYYAKEQEKVIIWNDNFIDIKWPITIDPLLSSADRDASGIKP